MDPIQYITEGGPDSDLYGYKGPGWYFWDETWTQANGPYPDLEKAKKAMRKYEEFLSGDRGKGPAKGMYIHLREKDDD